MAGQYRYVLVTPVGEFYSERQDGDLKTALSRVPLLGDLEQKLNRIERWTGDTWEVA